MRQDPLQVVIQSLQHLFLSESVAYIHEPGSAAALLLGKALTAESRDGRFYYLHQIHFLFLAGDPTFLCAMSDDWHLPFFSFSKSLYFKTWGSADSLEIGACISLISPQVY